MCHLAFMGTPFCITPMSDRFCVRLFSELVSNQDEQCFASLSFAVDKICHLDINCNSAVIVMI